MFGEWPALYPVLSMCLGTQARLGIALGSFPTDIQSLNQILPI